MGGTEWGTFATRRHVETLRNCREGGTFSTRRHVGNCRVVFFLFFLISPRFGSGAPMFCSGFFFTLLLMCLRKLGVVANRSHCGLRETST